VKFQKFSVLKNLVDFLRLKIYL